MQVTVSGKNVDVPDELKSHATRKFSKVDITAGSTVIHLSDVYITSYQNSGSFENPGLTFTLGLSGWTDSASSEHTKSRPRHATSE